MNVMDAISKFKGEIPTEGCIDNWEVDFISSEISFKGEFVCGFDSFKYCVALLSCYGNEALS